MKNSRYDLVVGSIVGVLTLIGLIYWLITYRSESNATVISFRWMRSVNIMRYQTVSRSDWSIPPGGRQTRSYRAIHHYEDYISSYTEKRSCTGSGSSQVCTVTQEPDYSSRPVYQTKYDYDIEDWIINRTPIATASDHIPFWPDTTDIRDEHNPPQINDERLGMLISKYTIVAKSGDDIYSIDIPEDLWNSLEINDSCVLVFDVLGRILNVRTT